MTWGQIKSGELLLQNVYLTHHYKTESRPKIEGCMLFLDVINLLTLYKRVHTPLHDGPHMEIV